MEKFWGENVHSTPMSITSAVELSQPIESHVILGGGVAVCFCQHHAVIFAIAQLSCCDLGLTDRLSWHHL